jgi:hypothetical protein
VYWACPPHSLDVSSCLFSVGVRPSHSPQREYRARVLTIIPSPPSCCLDSSALTASSLGRREAERYPPRGGLTAASCTCGLHGHRSPRASAADDEDDVASGRALHDPPLPMILGYPLSEDPGCPLRGAVAGPSEAMTSTACLTMELASWFPYCRCCVLDLYAAARCSCRGPWRGDTGSDARAAVRCCRG